MGRKAPKPEPSLHDRAKQLTDIVHDAAARRVYQILEEVVEANIKPLEARISVAIDQLRATEAKIRAGMPTERILIAIDMTARDLAGHETV